MDYNQILIIVFGLFYFGFIIYTRRKSDFTEFSVAGRSLGTFMIFASISATYIGPGSTMGISRNGFANGWFLNYIATFSGLGMVIVGFWIAPKVREKFVDSYSIGDVLGGPMTHNHRLVKLLIGITSSIFMASLAIVMSYAGGELLNNMFGFSKFWSITIVTCIVIIYSCFGGIRSTIQTDAFQFSLFAFLIPILAILIFFNDAFSWEAYMNYTAPRTEVAFDEQSVVLILGMVVWWMVSGSGLSPEIFSRYLSSKDDGVAKWATVYSGIYYAFWVMVMVFIGSAGAFLYPDLADNDQILLHIAEAQFPGVLYGIFIITMIGVVMSTQDSTLNASSIIFSEDVMSVLKPGISGPQKLIYARATTIVVGIVAILIAGFMDSVLGAIIIVVSYYLPVVIPVVVFSIIKDKHHWQSAIASMVAGFVVYLVWDIAGTEAIPPLLVGLGSSTLIYLGVDFYIENRRGE